MSKKNTDTRLTPAEEIDVLLESILSTPMVYVEGKDDVVIYREIAHKANSQLLNFANFGGRTSLFEFWALYQLQKKKIRRSVLCFADKDLFVFSTPPTQYAGIHFTKGYSIENDLFQDGFNHLQMQLRPKERERWAQITASLAEWFGHAIAQFSQEEDIRNQIDITFKNPSNLEPHSSTISPELFSSLTRTPEGNVLATTIKAQFVQLVRGKYLFDIFWRIFMDRNDDAGPPYIDKQFWHICIAEGLRDGAADSNCKRIATILSI